MSALIAVSTRGGRARVRGGKGRRATVGPVMRDVMAEREAVGGRGAITAEDRDKRGNLPKVKIRVDRELSSNTGKDF